MSLTRRPATGSWTKAMELDDLWEGDMVGVSLDKADVLLINLDGEIRAYDNRCPHAQSRLSEGDLEDGIVTCPIHLWEFDAATGGGVNPANCKLKSFPVFVEDGVIYVDLD